MFTFAAIFVVVLLNNKKYTFNYSCTVNVEIMSKMFEMFENINKIIIWKAQGVPQ